MLICIVARNCSWIGLGLMFETLLLAWQHMLSQRNAYATYRTMFTSYFSMRVPNTRRTDSCSSAVFSHYLVDVLRAQLPYPHCSFCHQELLPATPQADGFHSTTCTQ